MEWKRGPVIGRGSSATVYLATTVSGEVFAVKSSDLCSSIWLQNEERVISELCSPYVVKCLGSDVTRDGGKTMFNLFMEYVAGGTLSDLIRSRGGSLDEKSIQFYAHQIVKGLDYIHGKGIVHCDIKGQNILISDDGVKIGDFGCAKWGANCESVIAGTPAYMAPEVARGEKQGCDADIWALGCTIIEMATGANPWPEIKDPVSVLYRVAFSGDAVEFPDWLSNTAKDFLSRCLTKDPSERWTAAELQHHPFIHEYSGKYRAPTRESPTSVTDQAFWDQIEDPESSTVTSSSSNSPAIRIRSLIGNESDSNFPNWGEEEDWLKIRGNNEEESSPQQNEEFSESSNADESDTEASEEETTFNSDSLNITEEHDPLVSLNKFVLISEEKSFLSAHISPSNFSNFPIGNKFILLRNNLKRINFDS